MTPELIKQFIAIFSSLSLLLTNISAKLDAPKCLTVGKQGQCLVLQEKAPSGLLGAATGSGQFPTSTLNNFQDGDTINAGDWNALERKIGVDHSTDTTSLDYILRSATSSDPGHKHTTSTVTGTFGVAAGGTATSTYTYGVVVASGTQAFTTIAPGANGQLLTSNGVSWASTPATSTGMSVFYASTTWSVPTNVSNIFVSGIGPGGGGAGSQSTLTSGGAGGGTGFWALRAPTSITPGSSLVITIGNPGQGGNGNNTSGTPGTATTIGSFLTLNAGGSPSSTTAFAAATGTISGTALTGNSAAGASGATNAGGAGGTLLSGAWICVGGAGGPSGGGSGTTSTIGYGCGGGGGGQNGGNNGNGAAGGPSMVIIEY